MNLLNQKCLRECKEPLYCSPQWLYQFTLPPTMQASSLLSTPSPEFTIFKLLDDGHSDQCGVILDCSFDCISLIISDVEHFSCAYRPSVCLLWRNAYLGLQPFFQLGLFVFFVAVKLYELFYILEIQFSSVQLLSHVRLFETP